MRRFPSLLPGLLLFTLPLLPLSIAQAQQPNGILIAQASSSLAARLRANLPNRGAPGSRFGGATRGNCISGEQRLTALLPSTNLGQTIAANPNLFIFVPTTIAQQAELVISDPDTNTVISTDVLTLPGKPGVMQVQPVLALDPGQDYNWSFTLICDSNDPSSFVSVSGTIERVELNTAMATKLQSQNPQERLGAAVDAGLWYETLTILAELQQTNPVNSMAQTEWQGILTAVGLEAIAQEPLLQ